MHTETILVVGGAGYIGSHMVQLLLEHKYRVVVLDNFSTGFHALVVGGELVEGSLGDCDLLDRIFNEFRIHAVMHFAAYSLVAESVSAPLKYYRNNVSETLALVAAMIRHEIKRFIFSSTAAVYGEPEKIPIDEEHPCRPTNPYGNTKLSIERMLADCEAAYGLKSISLRYFNAAGAHASGRIGEMHDPESHLIPLVLKAALSSAPVKIFGNDYPTRDGTCVRDYVHVSDLAQAHLLALEALSGGSKSDIYNLGNSIGYTVRQVIDLARKVTGKPIEALECGRRAGDPAVLVADSTKIRKALGWRPRYEDLEAIIRTAWQWHSR
ncbi:MAG: UDP-glucose 4-epimerase GalE [Desulfobacteraceae bacterium]|nr:MAG: UDP-glucose 4-epimerase GalE [Desulfobacteraceae bacterium]